jgi:hypothetical protein
VGGETSGKRVIGSNARLSIDIAQWESKLRDILYPGPHVSEDLATMLMSTLSEETKLRLLQRLRDGKMGRDLIS